MQLRQQGAEASQDQTGGETPIAQATNAAGEAIAQRLYHRVDPGPGVIPLNVTQASVRAGSAAGQWTASDAGCDPAPMGIIYKRLVGRLAAAVVPVPRAARCSPG